MYMSKDVKNSGYFSKPEGIYEQNVLGNPAVVHNTLCRQCMAYCGIVYNIHNVINVCALINS